MDYLKLAIFLAAVVTNLDSLLGKHMKAKRTRHDFFYFQIATRYFLNYLKLVKELFNEELVQSLKNGVKELSELEKENFNKDKLDEIIEKFCLKEFTLNFFRMRSFGAITVVFSAMCLEALINDYCVLKKSSNYFKKYINKLDTVSKWLIVPNLITGKAISTDGQTFQLIKELFALRNDLVHPKSKELESLEYTNNTLLQDIKDFVFKVPQCYRAIKEATFELNKIDNEFQYLDDYKWLWGENDKFKNLSDIENFYLSLINDMSFIK